MKQLPSLSILILLFFDCQISYCQNLVPNPSFEEYNYTVIYKPFGNSADDFIKKVKIWSTPNNATPDFITVSSKSIHTFGNTHSGFNMIGLITQPNWYEYADVQLIEKLNKHTTYTIEFHVKRSKINFMVGTNPSVDPGFASPYFGIFLGKKPFLTKRNKPIRATPQITIPKKTWIGKEWVKISKQFTPTDDFDYLCIGQFQPLSDSNHQVISGYLFVDDIKIEEIKSLDLMNLDSFEIGTIIPLKNIFFETGKAKLKEESFQELNAVISFLKKNKTISIKINGHTDNKGFRKNNQKFSEKRAKTVFDFLINNQIPPRQLKWEGFGETKPKVENQTTENRNENRRVEFEIINK